VGGKTVSLSGMEPKLIRFTHDAPPLEVDQNGEFDAFQMYVQYVRLARPRFRTPLLLWHGGSLTGATWETTPDGRPGWQTFFLRRGYDVYVSDAVERGRSGWQRFPEIYPTEPVFRSKREAWELFRIAGSAFPAEAFDAMTKSIVPRWTSTDEYALDAYAALLERVRHAVVVAHSQGAAYALALAARAPERFAAVVAVEPSAVPAEAGSVPTLILWGENARAHSFWAPIVATSQAYHRSLQASGVDAAFEEMHNKSGPPNSHVPMMDRNSDAIAERIATWIERRLRERRRASPRRRVLADA
jgi:pimeloyl-ACP methyl ester carboxylesterase